MSNFELSDEAAAAITAVIISDVDKFVPKKLDEMFAELEIEDLEAAYKKLRSLFSSNKSVGEFILGMVHRGVRDGLISAEVEMQRWYATNTDHLEEADEFVTINMNDPWVIDEGSDRDVFAIDTNNDLETVRECFQAPRLWLRANE